MPASVPGTAARRVRRFVLLLLFGIAAPGYAQRPAPPDPARAAAPVPAVPYRSAFDGYRRFGDTRPADWKAVNDEVARAGGHIGILKAEPAGTASTPQPPSAPSSSPAAPAPRPAAGGHDAHHK